MRRLRRPTEPAYRRRLRQRAVRQQIRLYADQQAALMDLQWRLVAICQPPSIALLLDGAPLWLRRIFGRA